MKRMNYSSGAPLEEIVGYSRMVKVGEHIYIGGTTAVQPDGSVYGESPYAQAKYIFEKFIGLLKQADAQPKDVIKVKAYVTDMTFAKEVGEAFSEYFKEIKPLFTMVETPKLNRPTQYVEIELEAVLNCELV
ncbi:RidA family protein [Anaeromicropila populeti]|uniref:Enamine deaminase RidA, house cleaning of reactive enamine intermediates, YjgF/YER057c/UK114 family n=1 Tax=Anaeromicropila populeti TaxID=37658 RepID=A0A1I6HN90_9FIRM|nr:RidA family protein [Anaeromicropila populeti]SFR55943.1 Enamine deaminase RidA, house cleaning of reactive enamine intermediates, YjgF/YER057c/UK114 family [Anaeromicropila populeti]